MMPSLKTANWRISSKKPRNISERLRICCKNAGIADPYAVMLTDRISPTDATKVQALCAYAGTTAQAKTWNEFFAQELATTDTDTARIKPAILISFLMAFI